MRALNEQELAIIRELREEAGVLVDLNGNRLPQADGAVVVFCGDCDHSGDQLRVHAAQQEGQREDPRMHLLTMNGGALRLAPDAVSRVNKHGRDHGTYMDDVRDSLSWKGLGTVALIGHAPCGRAGDAGLDVPEVFRHLLAAKRCVKGAFNGDGRLVVACFFHAAYPANEPGGDLRRRTYFVDPKRLEAWLATRF